MEIKDKELQAAIDRVRSEIKDAVDGMAAVEDVEKRVAAGEQELKSAREEIDKIGESVKKRDAEIETLQREARQARLDADPNLTKRQATAALGMYVRRELCAHNRIDVPTRYRDEAETMKRFVEQRGQRATLEADAGDGLNLIPTILSEDIIDTLEEVSEMMGMVDFQPDLPSKVDFPTLTGRPTLQPKRATVDTDMTQSDPTFTSTAFDPDEAYVYFPIDNKLIDMSPLALGALAMQLVRDSIAQGLANWIVNADGTATFNSNVGLLNETDANFIVTLDAAETAFADYDNNDLNKAIANNLKRGRGASAVWLMSVFVRGVAEDLAREGKVPVITVNAQGEPMMKFRRIVIEEEMPDEADSAADTGFLVFGDLKTILLGIVGGVQMATSTDVLFRRNQTAWRGTINVDIVRKPVKTLTLIKTAAV